MTTYLGVTPPISVAPPSARDLEVSKTLIQELQDRGVYEKPEEGRNREIVLARLDKLVKQFVYQSSLNHGLSDAKAREAGGKIFTFGSYRLGVHGPGSDIDTLLVVPRHVEREEFHTLFESMLKETEGVVEVTSVPKAFVPIIKCTFAGIDIDLLFARLALPSIPDDLELKDDNLLRNLDERCVRSLGGSRVTDEMLRLVPDVPVFREALRTIKLWAQRRAIYGNVMGFCGGVAWAMLVARICQLYPKGCVGSIISRFFIIMHQWQWPAPVLLRPIEEGPLQVPVWNPKVGVAHFHGFSTSFLTKLYALAQLYPSDRSHRMPIITPAYPSMCSTHNVTLSTQQIMTAEFKRAAEIVDKVFVGSAKWAELFQPHDFFSKYRYYLQITASSSNADVQLKWSGTVESRIRQLVMKLEYVDTLLLAHPFVKSFDRTNYCLNEEEQRAVSIGEVPVEVEKRTEKDLKEGEGGTVFTTTFYIGLQIERRPAGAQQGTRKLDISYPTNEFTKLVKLWDNYDAETMGVIVRYIKSPARTSDSRQTLTSERARSSALPPYVFAGREPEPPKTGGVKRAKTKKTNGANASTATPAAASTGATANAAEDSDAERLNKKHRASSFVPENATPTPAGLPPVPVQPLPTNENGAAAVPQEVRHAAEVAVGATGGAGENATNGVADASGQPAVSLPGLETSLPVGEINGLASAVTNGGPQNQAAIMPTAGDMPQHP
ncbi:putative Polynucleotide adenylyltransferase [Rhodotorula taiwanensis]|uniref:Poly(A) polymerase n=1 Tax=Rhodotorula taiwanensis TaxID=741276 RepID=A0A2S5B5C5_9BASI|nr:putative Polynucleotide adenylyltransferase [Rhodotorula taiwanensis]